VSNIFSSAAADDAAAAGGSGRGLVNIATRICDSHIPAGPFIESVARDLAENCPEPVSALTADDLATAANIVMALEQRNIKKVITLCSEPSKFNLFGINPHSTDRSCFMHIFSHDTDFLNKLAEHFPMSIYAGLRAIKETTGLQSGPAELFHSLEEQSADYNTQQELKTIFCNSRERRLREIANENPKNKTSLLKAMRPNREASIFLKGFIAQRIKEHHRLSMKLEAVLKREAKQYVKDQIAALPEPFEQLFVNLTKAEMTYLYRAARKFGGTDISKLSPTGNNFCHVHREATSKLKYFFLRGPEAFSAMMEQRNAQGKTPKELIYGSPNKAPRAFVSKWDMLQNPPVQGQQSQAAKRKKAQVMPESTIELPFEANETPETCLGSPIELLLGLKKGRL
jgi:hypothetical protein